MKKLISATCVTVLMMTLFSVAQKPVEVENAVEVFKETQQTDGEDTKSIYSGFSQSMYELHMELQEKDKEKLKYELISEQKRLESQLTEMQLQSELEEERIEAERQAEVERNTAYVVSSANPYPGYFTQWMDLQNRIELTTDQMNYLIDYFVGSQWSALSGTGDAFITASKETGLDPIFLLCLCGQESSWGTNPRHINKSNAYSINMCDGAEDNGYVMGQTFSEGIINGAIWINDHYYKQGQTCAYSFIYGKKCYASAKDLWINTLVRNMDTSYKLLIEY